MRLAYITRMDITSGPQIQQAAGVIASGHAGNGRKTSAHAQRTTDVIGGSAMAIQRAYNGAQYIVFGGHVTWIMASKGGAA